MRRRTFLQSFAGFAGALALGIDSLQLSWEFPFVHRRRVVPQVVASVAAQGETAIMLPVSHAQKGDVLIAMVAAHCPDGAPTEWADISDWKLISSQEAGNVVQRFWHQTTDSRLEDKAFWFTNDSADKMVGQLLVVRGVDKVSTSDTSSWTTHVTV